jgi:hypothetical protein
MGFRSHGGEDGGHAICEVVLGEDGGTAKLESGSNISIDVRDDSPGNSEESVSDFQIAL